METMLIDELWLRILEAEKNEQILVKIHVGWPSDADPTSLFRILYKFFGDNEQKCMLSVF